MGYDDNDGKIEVLNPRDEDITRLETENDYAGRNFTHVMERIEHDYRRFELRPEHLVEIASVCYDLLKGDKIKIKDGRHKAPKQSIHTEDIKQETQKTRSQFMYE